MNYYFSKTKYFRIQNHTFSIYNDNLACIKTRRQTRFNNI